MIKKKEAQGMKTAVVYYSLTGNTQFAARRIAEKLGAELIRIAPEKEYPDSGVKKFFWGGKSAVMGETPRLMPHSFRAQDYDLIILGTPVWAGTFAPPLRTLIRENQAAWQGKRLAAFVCFSGGGAEKALEKIKKELAVSTLDAQLILIDPQSKPSPDNERKIDSFCNALNKR